MAPAAPKMSDGEALAASVNFSDEVVLKGAKVWFQNADRTWTGGELKSVPGPDGGVVAVQEEKSGRTVDIDISKLVPANPQLQEGITDLTNLSYLNEPCILHNLDFRYHANEIYTLAGPVLIALNPCKSLPLYTPEVANAYKAGARDVVHNLPPHIYLVAANAFRKMLREKQNQSLIVNGESGAGKTETTKKAMQYFATLAGGTGIEDQVLETNPVLEAFGNAKTLRNHNSSRFGKLIQIFFNKGHHICGARIKTYLLEKSRVVHQLKGERSFHIFYQLVRGATSEERAAYRLPDSPEAFRFLNQSGCMNIEGVDDGADYRVVCAALHDVGVDDAAVTNVFSLLSGLLWLGNVEFMPNEHDHSNDSTHVKNNEALQNACVLLGISRSAMCSALTQKRIITPSEIITKLLNVDDSQDCRDSLAKAIYSSVFSFVVDCINKKLDTGKSSSGLSISILDIYGFEQFAKNSFEQLCINYANERLQQQFTKHLFTLEQQEYEAEGIDWTKVEFVDNQLSLDVIEMQHPKGLGVLATLDDQCRFPKASDETFVHKLRESMSGHSHFEVPLRAQKDFVVVHYAGGVQYSCDGFLDKNKDTLNVDIVDVMCDSHHALLPRLGSAIQEDMDSKQRGGQTVGGRFSSQLKELIGELDKTGLHFVRCIKPNAALKPDLFESPMTLHQLRCCGVLEVARIARAGFPTRYTHRQFADRYVILLPPAEQVQLHHSANAIAACQQLIAKFGLTSEQYQLGKTKIFFRPGVLGYVEDMWARIQSSVLKIQAIWRMYSQRKQYKSIQQGALAVQTLYRARTDMVAFGVALQQWRAAIVVQTSWRAHAAHNGYQTVLRSVWCIQMAYRRYRFRLRVWGRVLERMEGERLVKVEQESYVSLRNQYGCDLAEVHAAMEMYKAANAGVPYTPAHQAAHEAPIDRFYAPTAVTSAATIAAAAEDSTRSLEYSALPCSPAADMSTSVAGMDALSRASTTAGDLAATFSGASAVSSAHMYESTRELAGQLEKLQLENMRLQKAVQLERSLKERYQRKFEDQNVNWMEQIRTLQLYIVQVRSAYGGHRLPPLPSGLFEPPTNAMTPPVARRSTMDATMVNASMATTANGAVNGGEVHQLDPSASFDAMDVDEDAGLVGAALGTGAAVAALGSDEAKPPDDHASLAAAADADAATTPADAADRNVDATDIARSADAADAPNMDLTTVLGGGDHDRGGAPVQDDSNNSHSVAKTAAAAAVATGTTATSLSATDTIANGGGSSSPDGGVLPSAFDAAASAPTVDTATAAAPPNTAAAATAGGGVAAVAAPAFVRSGRGGHLSRGLMDPSSYLMHGADEDEEAPPRAPPAPAAHAAGGKVCEWVQLYAMEGVDEESARKTPPQAAHGRAAEGSSAAPSGMAGLPPPPAIATASPFAEQQAQPVVRQDTLSRSPVAPFRAAGATHSVPPLQASASQKYVGQLVGELDRVSQVLRDDVDFISEVKHGLAEAHDMDPNMELLKLKRKFEIWKREFKEKLKTTEDVLRKIDKLGGPGASSSRRFTAPSQQRSSNPNLLPSPSWRVDQHLPSGSSGNGHNLLASPSPRGPAAVPPQLSPADSSGSLVSNRSSQPLPPPLSNCSSARSSQPSTSSIPAPPGTGSRPVQPPPKRKGSGFISNLFK